MSKAIDPYIEILQLDPADCPPDHYVLLGLPRYTSDRQQIESAASEQIRYVRPFVRKYQAEGTQLLNELTKAKLCLLDDEERTAYDAYLRQTENTVALERVGGNAIAADSDSFADAFGDELDAMAERPADHRTRRCPHCGSGLFDRDKICQACVGGLADGTAWNTVKCPECFNPLRRGAVCCEKCYADFSLTDVIGCIPSHVPGSVQPFECRKRKKLRAARKLGMLAWTQNADAGKPTGARDDDRPESAADETSTTDSTKHRREAGEPLPTIPALFIEAVGAISEQFGVDGDVRKAWTRRYRAVAAWHRDHGIRGIAAYIFTALIPLLGLFVVVKLIVSTDEPVPDRSSRAVLPAGPIADAENPKDTENVRDIENAASSQESTEKETPIEEPHRISEMSVAELRFERLGAEASELLKNPPPKTAAGIRSVLDVLQKVQELEADAGNDASIKNQLASVKDDLIGYGSDGMREALRQARGQKTDDEAEYTAILELLNDPDALLLKEGAKWRSARSYAETLVRLDAMDRVAAISSEDDSGLVQYLANLKAPLLIREYTPRLQSMVVDRVDRDIQERMKRFGEEGNVAGGLRFLNDLESSPLGEEFLRSSVTWYQQLATNTIHSTRYKDASQLQLLVEKAQAYDDPRVRTMEANLQKKIEELTILETLLAKTVGVTTESEGLELVGHEHRDEYDGVRRKLQLENNDSCVDENHCWYVVAFDNSTQLAVLESVHRATTIMLLYKHEVRSARFRVRYAPSKDQADELLQEGADQMEWFPYPPPARSRAPAQIPPKRGSRPSR